LFFDAFQRAFLHLGVVHGKDGLPAVQEHLEVRAFSGREGGTLLREPAFELITVHVMNNKQICLYYQALSRGMNTFQRV
jgi:hypothetical protein